MIKEGTKVKVVGITDRNDKQVYGKVIQLDPEGLALVDIGDKVIAVLPSDLEVKK